MEAATAGDLLREARIRHGLSQEDLAIRAGIARVVPSDIEADRISPTVEMLGQLLELLGEDLVLGAEERSGGGWRSRMLFVRTAAGGADGLGRSLRPGPLLRVFAHHGSDFVVIGSIAGLAHGSAYPTFDLDVAYAGCLENLNRLASALGEIGVRVDSQVLGEHDALCFDTDFGTLDILQRERAAGRRKDQLMAMEYIELAGEIRRREAEKRES